METSEISREPGLSLAEKYQAAYRPAQASKRVIDYFLAHPFCELKELQQATGLKYIKKDYPEIKELTRELITRRQQVKHAYEAIQSDTGESGNNIAQALFTAIKPSGIPQDKIEMGSLRSPLALSISLGPADFAKIDPRDVGGHYRESSVLKIKDKILFTPLIAINRVYQLDEIISKHETCHAVNDLFTLALEASNKELLWEKQIPWNQSTRIDRAIPVIKNEVVVRLMTGENVDVVGTKNHLYDPFKGEYTSDGRRLSADEDWDEYYARINGSMETVMKVKKVYDSFGLKDKMEILPWILMRIPLEEWTAKLNEIGVTSEIELLEKIRIKTGGKVDENLLHILAKKEELLVYDLVNYVER